MHHYELFVFLRPFVERINAITERLNHLLTPYAETSPEWTLNESDHGTIYTTQALVAVEAKEKDVLARALAESVWEINEMYCKVIVTFTPVEQYTTYYFSEKEYRRATKKAA